jgi:hypothetical protein
VSTLVATLVGFNENGAEQLLTEAFALYPLEHVGEHLIAPALFEIGERWQRGETSVAQEHFATNFCSGALSHSSIRSIVRRRGR